MKIESEILEIFWNDIPTDARIARTYEELMILWETTRRQTRRILHELSLYDNGDNYVLIRSGVGKGFYRTDIPAIIEAYRRECLSKGLSNLAPLKKINRIIKSDENQMTLDELLETV